MNADLEKDRLERSAKKFVNERRKELGLRALGRLKRGYPGSPILCCLATSLESVGVHEVGYYIDEPDIIVLTAKDGRCRDFNAPGISDFIDAFDNGEFQHLEIPSTPIKHKKPGERKMTIIEPAKYANGDVAE